MKHLQIFFGCILLIILIVFGILVSSYQNTDPPSSLDMISGKVIEVDYKEGKCCRDGLDATSPTLTARIMLEGQALELYNRSGLHVQETLEMLKEAMTEKIDVRFWVGKRQENRFHLYYLEVSGERLHLMYYP